MQICKQLLTGVTVLGSVSKKTGIRAEYVITGWPTPRCPCVSFAISRNRAVSVREDVEQNHPDAIAWCKHLEQHYGELCHFTEGKDGASMIPGICPFCGGPTVEVNVLGECRDCHQPLTNDSVALGLCDTCLVARV